MIANCQIIVPNILYLGENYYLNKEKLYKKLVERSYKKGCFTLASGKKSNHYFNCKPVSINGIGLELISNLFPDEYIPS